MMKDVSVAILGASGYTGAELVRLLALHPAFHVKVMTGDRKAGQSMDSVFPHLGGLKLPNLVAIDQVDFKTVDAVFCCLPHGTTQEVIAALPASVKVVDLSADFRLFNVDTYAQWYGHEHRAPDLQKQAVYGLTELARGPVAKARLVANPGCYPTSVQLPLIPLLKAGLIEATDIVIDAKSGVSGAGRAAKEANLYTEVTEGMHAYGVASHRHSPEIEQGLSEAAGAPVLVTFTPHLIPMSRGMLSTIYVKTKKGAKAADLRACLAKTYNDEPFVRVLPEGVVPHTRHVRGSNHCLMSVFDDRVPGRIIITSVIDNLVKGASGQALQNMNLMFGLPETLGLEQQPLFP
ncbi:N-acetyl-gamma-glutamyl-phosphate reductase [Magnetospirillum sp. XM-1]|uniref:N-acetyl-gamma-glutamyl-phosphate reductase n=1 Tax=Magnetospirillum sp. XM-1 TaxID=1663591 RepID=UPI0015615F8B|nr:N-acetyl-gamma-glutamyl-phosphate reductase [Magnetospirillum sp. XM-1]